MSTTTKDKKHYVNNKQFSQAIVDYVMKLNYAREEGLEEPPVPDYVAHSFLLIAEGLSHKSNFIRYPYREEMVMDAVENCLRAISNYNVDTKTRGGLPNAFGYFTKICWFAFIRRINKERRQLDIKMKVMQDADLDQLIAEVEHDNSSDNQAFVEFLRERVGEYFGNDDEMTAKERELYKRLNQHQNQSRVTKGKAERKPDNPIPKHSTVDQVFESQEI